MVVGQTGLTGETAVSPVAGDPNCAVVLAPIPLHLEVELTALGPGPSLASVF